MEPSYLHERSEAAEAMRRLLFAGAVLIAASAGEVEKKALKALEGLLGPGSVPWTINPAAIREDLSHRIERVKDIVPPLRRAQVIRDLCVIARADGVITEAEGRILLEIADAVGVDRALVTCTAIEAPDAHTPARPMGGFPVASDS